MHSRLVAALAAALLVVAPAARAQLAVGCDRERTTIFRFGLAGGDLMPSLTELATDGTLRRRSTESVGPVLGRVPRDSVLALARRAWAGGFALLPPAPAEPPRNNAPRRVIEVRSRCGSKHVEYDVGHESPLFAELWGRLNRLAAPSARARRR